MTPQAANNEPLLIRYSECAPPADLALVVLSYWEFAAAEIETPYHHQVFPDGCASFVYYRNRHVNISWLQVAGPRLNPLTVSVHAGDTYWGMRLAPITCRMTLGCDPATLLGQSLPVVAISPTYGRQLYEQLNRAVSFTEAMRAYDQFLRSSNRTSIEVDQVVVAAVDLIEKSRGSQKIAEIAAAVGLSTRQLERRFRSVTGLTPKQFARLRRVRATAVTLVEDRQKNWAERAATMGFADQAHLTREFIAMTGRSPGAFAEAIAEIEHGKLVK